MACSCCTDPNGPMAIELICGHVFCANCQTKYRHDPCIICEPEQNVKEWEARNARTERLRSNV